MRCAARAKDRCPAQLINEKKKKKKRPFQKKKKKTPLDLLRSTVGRNLALQEYPE
jgi:hypothetical protein